MDHRMALAQRLLGLISSYTVVPAQAGTHDHRLWNMGPRLRGDDGRSQSDEFPHHLYHALSRSARHSVTPLPPIAVFAGLRPAAEARGGVNGPLLRPDQMPTWQILRSCE